MSEGFTGGWMMSRIGELQLELDEAIKQRNHQAERAMGYEGWMMKREAERDEALAKLQVAKEALEEYAKIYYPGPPANQMAVAALAKINEGDR